MVERIFAVRAISGVDRKKGSKTLPRKSLMNTVANELVEKVGTRGCVILTPPVKYITGNSAVIEDCFQRKGIRRPEIIHTRKMASIIGNIATYRRLLEEIKERKEENVVAVGYNVFMLDFTSWLFGELGLNTFYGFANFGKNRCASINLGKKTFDFFGEVEYYDGGSIDYQEQYREIEEDRGEIEKSVEAERGVWPTEPEYEPIEPRIFRRLNAARHQRKKI